MFSAIFGGLFIGLTYSARLSAEALDSPVETFGALSVSENQIVGSSGDTVSLAGVSFFWSNSKWKAERFFDKEVVRYLDSEWNAGIVRAAMGVEGRGGYLELPAENRERVEVVISAAIDQGLYVIIDWHSHHAEDHISEAVEFFSVMAEKYGDHPNVIYEIYNEPLKNVDWSTVIKPYALEVISAIRAIDPDNLIVVGTPSWSQDVDIAAKDPIEGFDNIAYALHFYAGTHKGKLRKKAQVALKSGIPIFVTEWGSVNADGDGKVDHKSTKQWMRFMEKNGLIHCNWAMNDKLEGASILKPNLDVANVEEWSESDLTESGKLVHGIVKNWGKE